jgi:hypothetical protein
MSNMQNTILIGTVIVASLPVAPVGHYLCFGWPTRKYQIVRRFSDTAIGFYKATFCPEGTFATSQEFSEEYDKQYGRRLFLFPVFLFIVTACFLSYLSVRWVFSHDWSGAGDGTDKIAIFSLAGAYIWITYDLIVRARQNDIVTSDVNRATLRLLVSLPFGFAISAFAGVVSDSSVTLSTNALAFFVGAFPTDTVLKFMRRTAGIPLKLDADTIGDNVQQLIKIDGVSVPIAERFIDEGVKTNLQLAYTPIALTIKSGMDFAFILDCCGQALVRMYFTDDQMKVVNQFGLRTGVEIASLTNVLDQYDAIVDAATKAGTAAPPRNAAQANAESQMQSFSKQLEMDTYAVRFILGQIVGDPYTRFACDIWDT